MKALTATPRPFKSRRSSCTEATQQEVSTSRAFYRRGTAAFLRKQTASTARSRLLRTSLVKRSLQQRLFEWSTSRLSTLSSSR
eukprot:842060-Prorocentrum_lima.AAC.1